MSFTTSLKSKQCCSGQWGTLAPPPQLGPFLSGTPSEVSFL